MKILRPSFLVLLLFAAGCMRPEPREIRYGEMSCDYCHMTIAEPSFAAQLVTRTGKVYVFDDVADLAAFTGEGRVPEAEVHGLWVNLMLHPDQRVPVDSAVFLLSDRLRSPMAGGLAAFRSYEEADSLRSEIGGELIRWSELKVRLSSPARLADL